MANLVLWGIVAHLIADWILQNEWMALNKVSLKHPAAYVHSGIHMVAAALAGLGLAGSVFVGVTHILIDTRVPLSWWRWVFRQTTEGLMAPHVAIWEDQVAHVAMIVLAVWLRGII